MTNAGNKKLLALLVTLVLLASGLIAMGSTFAGQVNYNDAMVDLNTNENVMTYKVDIECYDPSATGNDPYAISLMTNADVFTGSNVYWCPGKTEIVYLRITNNEKFPIDCSLDMNVKESGFDNVLSYAVIAEDLKTGTVTHPANWSKFVEAASVSDTLAIGNDENLLFENAPIEAGGVRYYAVAMHMDEKATSEYQGKTLKMTFDFRVNANYQTGDTPSGEAK